MGIFIRSSRNLQINDVRPPRGHDPKLKTTDQADLHAIVQMHDLCLKIRWRPVGISKNMFRSNPNVEVNELLRLFACHGLL